MAVPASMLRESPVRAPPGRGAPHVAIGETLRERLDLGLLVGRRLDRLHDAANRGVQPDPVDPDHHLASSTAVAANTVSPERRSTGSASPVIVC